MFSFLLCEKVCINPNFDGGWFDHAICIGFGIFPFITWNKLIYSGGGWACVWCFIFLSFHSLFRCIKRIAFCGVFGFLLLFLCLSLVQFGCCWPQAREFHVKLWKEDNYKNVISNGKGDLNGISLRKYCSHSVGFFYFDSLSGVFFFPLLVFRLFSTLFILPQ